MEFIKRSSDYALRGLIHMAGFPKGKVFYLDSVAKETNAPPVFLHKIFQRLSKSEMLISHRGIKGGFSIAKNPAKTTAREIIEVLQGPITLNRCLTKEDKCNRSQFCSARKNLSLIQEKFIDILDKLTLKKLAKEELGARSKERGVRGYLRS